MTLQKALYYGKQYLIQKNIDNSHMDAWYLMEYVFHIERSYFFLHQEEEINDEKWLRYKEVLEKRGRHIPLQHITGVQEFMGLDFFVNEHVLIPRQDTEILVEQVQSELKANMQVLDMCTGSGCIVISLLKYAQDITGTGVDISEEALLTARENGLRNEVEAKWLQSDLFEQVRGPYDIIVSNPPYIPTKVIDELMEEVRYHDPLLALDGKSDGLFFYRRIIREAGHYLKPGGMIFFEIGYEQGEAVSDMMKEHGFRQINIIKDLAGLDRVVRGKLELAES